MIVKYNRVSIMQQCGNRFSADNEKYDMMELGKLSGSVGKSFDVLFSGFGRNAQKLGCVEIRLPYTLDQVRIKNSFF